LDHKSVTNCQGYGEGRSHSEVKQFSGISLEGRGTARKAAAVRTVCVCGVFCERRTTGEWWVDKAVLGSVHGAIDVLRHLSDWKNWINPR